MSIRPDRRVERSASRELAPWCDEKAMAQARENSIRAHRRTIRAKMKAKKYEEAKK